MARLRSTAAACGFRAAYQPVDHGSSASDSRLYAYRAGGAIPRAGAALHACAAVPDRDRSIDGDENGMGADLDAFPATGAEIALENK
jgi:hypothetical protein